MMTQGLPSIYLKILNNQSPGTTLILSFIYIHIYLNRFRQDHREDIGNLSNLEPQESIVPLCEWQAILLEGSSSNTFSEPLLGIVAIYLIITLLLLSHFSRVPLCATPQMAGHQALPSLGFSRQEHWSGLPFPSPMHESKK